MLKQLSNDKKQITNFSFRAILSSILLIILIFSPLIQPAFAQQQTISVEQLKQQISLLESIDDSPNTSSEIKKINQKLLRERRGQLQELLKNQLDSMKEYFSKVQYALSEKEKHSINELIANLENDLKSIEEKLNIIQQNNLDINPNYLASTKPAFTVNISNADLQTTAGNKRPADGKSLSTKQNASEKFLSANSANAVLIQSDCYPDAPKALIDSIEVNAQIIVDRKDPTRITDDFFPILFYATAHAISVDAVDVDAEKRDLINRIKIKRLQQQTKITNKQIGATARAEGTTSAIEKPGFAELLGFAVENGAIQKLVDGTTLTLSTSPYSFVTATQGDTATAYKNYGYLSRLGISASFNIDNQDNVLLNASRKQLSEWNLRLRLSGDKSMRSQEAEDIWNSKVKGKFAKPALILTESLATQFRDQTLEAKRREIVDGFSTIAFTVPVNETLKDTSTTREQKINEIAKLILCRVKSEIFDKVRSGEFNIPTNKKKEIIEKTLPAYALALEEKEKAITTFEEDLEKLTFKPTYTLAYTNKREVNSSDYSTLKILFEKKIEKKLNWVANAGFSIYHKPNPMLNQRQYRDFAVAFSFEGLLGRSPFLSEELDESQITYSFTGRYQRLFENKGIAGKKADIGAGQFKLEFPLFTGVSLPFSLTYSNATEESRKASVRANFGVTLDTDKVFQVLKIKKLKTP